MLVTVLRRLENGAGDGDGSGFADVAPGSWYTGSVAWANAAGIIGGVSDTDFAPNRAITREELASTLYRYARYLGSDLVGATGAGAGAANEAEAGTGTGAGAANEAATGAGTGAGAATGSETGGGAAGASAGSATNPAAGSSAGAATGTATGSAAPAADPLAGFADRAELSTWATEVTRWAVETGLLAGRAGKDGVVLLAPKSEVTRAEAAVKLRRLLERLI
jgi:hypothetical protein